MAVVVGVGLLVLMLVVVIVVCMYRNYNRNRTDPKKNTTLQQKYWHHITKSNSSRYSVFGDPVELHLQFPLGLMVAI